MLIDSYEKYREPIEVRPEANLLIDSLKNNIVDMHLMEAEIRKYDDFAR